MCPNLAAQTLSTFRSRRKRVAWLAHCWASNSRSLNQRVTRTTQRVPPLPPASPKQVVPSLATHWSGQPLACGQPVDAYEPEGSGVGCRGVTGTAGRTSGGDSKAPPNLQCKGQKEHLPRIWTTKKGIAESFHCSTSLQRAALETL